jgi:hypothetical protein
MCDNAWLIDFFSPSYHDSRTLPTQIHTSKAFGDFLTRFWFFLVFKRFQCFMPIGILKTSSYDEHRAIFNDSDLVNSRIETERSLHKRRWKRKTSSVVRENEQEFGKQLVVK